jgi:non-ribosomal peptide synthetase component E (peptide arylation enzyme)
MEHFDAEEALKLIQRERITVGCVVPAQLAMMVSHPHLSEYDLSSIRLWWCVGALLPYHQGVEIEKKIGGVIVTGLGATDWGGFTISSIDEPPEVRLLTEGKPITGVEIKLVDDGGQEVPRGEMGEVWGRGEVCLSGYYKDPEATWKAWSKDGWFRMGDLGKWDEQGNLVVVGRKKDMIIRGGQNIYPIEIENLLVSHPKVADVAVVGMPDSVMGERVCAYVVPKTWQEITLEELVSFLKGKNIAPYKLPERLEIVGRIPMVAGEQKVDKKLLQQEIASKLKAEGKL